MEPALLTKQTRKTYHKVRQVAQASVRSCAVDIDAKDTHLSSDWAGLQLSYHVFNTVVTTNPTTVLPAANSFARMRQAIAVMAETFQQTATSASDHIRTSGYSLTLHEAQLPRVTASAIDNMVR